MLHIDTFVESEEPDARIVYDGKQIGVEVVGYHRSKTIVESLSALEKSLQKYEDRVNEKGERGKQISILISAQQAAHYNKNIHEDLLFEEISDCLNGVDRSYVFIDDVTADAILPLEDKCIVVYGSYGECHEIDTCKIKEIIHNKNEKLIRYKEKADNQDIDEYWLLIYVNYNEYDYFKKYVPYQIESDYTRIYLANLTDGVLRIK